MLLLVFWLADVSDGEDGLVVVTYTKEGYFFKGGIVLLGSTKILQNGNSYDYVPI